MRRFLYYIPGMPGANAKILANLGLLDRFSIVGGNLIEHSITGIDNGPAGTGCLIGAGSQPPTYDRSRQQWIEGGKFWVGVEDLPPRPQDLQREMGIGGYDITLADGQTWRVPLIRRWDAARYEHVSNLPKALKPKFVDGKHQFTAEVREDYRALDVMSGRLFDSFSNQASIPLDNACQMAAVLLAVNYRIDVEEAGLLGLFDETAVVQALALSIDYPAIQAHAAQMATEGLQPADAVILDEE